MIRPCMTTIPDWAAIDTVLLDLDGTLLDQAYDNHIWGELIPLRYAQAKGLDLRVASEEIERLFDDCSGTLKWYDIEHWTRTLGVEVGALHRELRSQVAWLPGAREFLQRVRAMGKRLVLLTNSHPVALAVKHEQTGVLDLLDGAASSQELGAPKENGEFWLAAQARFGYDPARSLFADDNAKMLEAGRRSGVRWVYGVRHWDTKLSRREHIDHPAVDAVLDLIGDIPRFPAKEDAAGSAATD